MTNCCLSAVQVLVLVEQLLRRQPMMQWRQARAHHQLPQRLQLRSSAHTAQSLRVLIHESVTGCNTLQLAKQNATRRRRRPSSYALVAGECQPATNTTSSFNDSPTCGNTPMQCPACPAATYVWRYCMDAHYSRHHPQLHAEGKVPVTAQRKAKEEQHMQAVIKKLPPLSV
jgi:hypothetical protein